MFNLFFLVFSAIAVGIGLSFLITRSKAPGQDAFILPEDDAKKDPTDKKRLVLSDLQKLGERLCAENNLTVKERIPDTEQEVYWVAESKNEFFFGNYVLGFLETTENHPIVTLTDLLEFKDFIKSVGSAKGFFFTTGYFSRDVHQPLEGPKVTLYNRIKVLDELIRLSIG